jgi:hypothetical protein
MIGPAASTVLLLACMLLPGAFSVDAAISVDARGNVRLDSAVPPQSAVFCNGNDVGGAMDQAWSALDQIEADVVFALDLIDVCHAIAVSF